jgi:hypothetical protein
MAKPHNSQTRVCARAAEDASHAQVLFAHVEKHKAVISKGGVEGSLAGRNVVLRGVVYTRPTNSQRQVEERRVKFVREASQRRLASHARIHDPDTNGDQPRRLIMRPELTSKPY